MRYSSYLTIIASLLLVPLAPAQAPVYERWEGPDGFFWGGIQAPGDCDGDGVTDLLVPYLFRGATGVDQRRVELRSGIDGSPTDPNPIFGPNPRPIGDVDADGRADFVIADGRAFSACAGAAGFELRF